MAGFREVRSSRRHPDWLDLAAPRAVVVAGPYVAPAIPAIHEALSIPVFHVFYPLAQLSRLTGTRAALRL
jgi:hypothetical protein